MANFDLAGYLNVQKEYAKDLVTYIITTWT